MRKLRGYIFIYLGTYYCFLGGEAGTESEVGEQDASGTTLSVTGMNTHKESAQSGLALWSPLPPAVELLGSAPDGGPSGRGTTSFESFQPWGWERLPTTANHR